MCKRTLVSIFLSVLIMTPSFSFGGDIRLMLPKFQAEEKKSEQGERYLVYGAKKEGNKTEHIETKLIEFIREFEKENYGVEQSKFG